ncbi:uncharacterized protein BKA55DRAFT_696623 [Fusarium redolens]|uniref:Uncharacterized protein n=1 Tax=Fusarium redolens TaxID=48865 RepID=A0A9P9G0N6_FUSRE|nr:uncharacterized protein BKA55DRAFT_696623 [Fusarium redolens]KAH7230063.1 hypothetical protein BKA55DRAFT_696623 [Fusarium redolens]
MPAKKPYLLISWPRPSSYNLPKRSFINLCCHALIIHHASAQHRHDVCYLKKPAAA